MTYAKKMDNFRARIDKKYSTQKNNPQGFNKHKVNPKSKIEIVKEITKLDVQMAYQDLWRAKCVMLSKAQKYSRLFKQFMDIDKIQKETEEEVKRLE